MADQGNTRVINNGATVQTKKRSALGIGITTLVTIMVVLLLVAFAVLSLVSARSNLELSQMATNQAQRYYTADSEATVWYAELDAFVATMDGSSVGFEEQLGQAGFEVQATDTGELQVTKGFSINNNRTLMVTITVNDDKTTTIRQWQA